jgi:cytoskeletal protein CcmA (bactofilin family)
VEETSINASEAIKIMLKVRVIRDIKTNRLDIA